jgi:hypothetical protein
MFFSRPDPPTFHKMPKRFDAITFGGFLARIGKGTRIHVESTT